MNNYYKIKNNTGALMIQFLIGIGIIALLTTLSVPYLRQFRPNLILSSTIRDLTTDLRYAQQLTITQQITHIVEFDEINDLYRILKINGATTTLKTVEFSSEVFYQSITGLSNNQVRFNSYGAVSEDGVIVLENTNNNTKTINVKPSGYIQLAD